MKPLTVGDLRRILSAIPASKDGLKVWLEDEFDYAVRAEVARVGEYAGPVSEFNEVLRIE